MSISGGFFQHESWAVNKFPGGLGLVKPLLLCISLEVRGPSKCAVRRGAFSRGASLQMAV